MIRQKTYNAVKKQLVERDKTIEQLRAEIFSAQHKMEKLYPEVSQLRENNRKLASELQDTKVERAEYLLRTRQLELAFNPVMQERDRRNAEVDRLLDEKEILLVKLEALQAENESFVSSVKGLQQGLQQITENK